jgi:hypothetical protein
MTLRTRPKKFLLRDALRGGDASEEAWRIPVTFYRQMQPRLVQRGSLLHAARDQLAYLCQLRTRIYRADIRILIDRIAHSQMLTTPSGSYAF